MIKASARAVVIAALVILGSPLVAHGSAGNAAARATLAPAARGAAATVDAFHAALRRGDVRRASALLADDALIFEEGEAESSKAEYAASHLTLDIEFLKAVREKVIRRSAQVQGSIAWVATETRLTGNFEGQPIDRQSTETMILRRSGPSWKIVHIHWSSIGSR